MTRRSSAPVRRPPDGSTFEDALRILKGRGVWDAVPVVAGERLSKGAAGEIEENPGPESEVFQKVRTFIAGNNSLALAAAAGEAERLGFRARIITDRQEGPVRGEAAVFAALIELESRNIAEGAAPLCLLEGGELTVEVKGRGLGGRNNGIHAGPPVGVERDGVRRAGRRDRVPRPASNGSRQVWERTA